MSTTTTSTTKKHAQFVSEPMGSKGVTAVPGIGKVTAAGLKGGGVTKAKQLYGNYLQSSNCLVLLNIKTSILRPTLTEKTASYSSIM